jgi:hypothetical protein
MPNDLPPFQTQGNSGGADALPRALWWFRVEALLADEDGPVNPGTATVVKARTWDGADKGGKDYLIAVNGSKAVGDTFYATKPKRTGITVGPDNNEIVWREVGGGVAVSWCKAVADWAPNAAPPDDFSIQVNPCDVTGVVPAGATPFRVYLTGNLSRRTHYAAIKANDILAFLPIPENNGVKGVLVSLPIVGGALYSLMQATGANAVGFDFLRVA